ncbi:hypothetical protein, partial [Prevotella histicola]|uniref:hypothetical protein n=1 Tax=Prevotella histicola TaxID=470565 RepID=UPI00288A5E9B
IKAVGTFFILNLSRTQVFIGANLRKSNGINKGNTAAGVLRKSIHNSAERQPLELENILLFYRKDILFFLIV